MTPICGMKRISGNVIITGAFVLLIVIGAIVVKATGNPSLSEGQIKPEQSSLQRQSGSQDLREGNGTGTVFDATPPSFSGNDALDRLRSLRSPVLEREILDIAGASVAEVVERKSKESDIADSSQFASSPLLQMQAGVFVTLIIDGKVRGCMGRIYPAEPNLGREIAKAAKMAATMDMRHPPIAAEELPKVDFCVSVVGRVRRESPDVERDPRLQGILVEAGGRSGVILPGEAKTSAYQRKWAKREAGIGPGVPFELYVFETERFGKTLPVRG